VSASGGKKFGRKEQGPEELKKFLEEERKKDECFLKWSVRKKTSHKRGVLTRDIKKGRFWKHKIYRLAKKSSQKLQKKVELMKA